MKISARQVNKNDDKFLLKVHNASVKSGYFDSKNLVKYSDHIKWLKSKLKSKDSQIYIGTKNHTRFGYVRFDKVKKDIFEVSLGNLPEFYSKGLGTKILGIALKKFTKKFKPKKVISVVKKFNIRSQKCFLKNGFVKTLFNELKHKTINKFNKKKSYFELTININN